MLVLSHKIGERIVISGNIEIAIVAIRGKKASLAVSAPPNVTVRRREVRDSIDDAQDENGLPWRGCHLIPGDNYPAAQPLSRAFR